MKKLLLILLCLPLLFTSCQKDVEGCTNPLASNYDTNATEDDGSCTFCETCIVTIKDYAFDDGLTQAEVDSLEAMALGQSFYDAIFEAAYGYSEGEYCGGDLDAIKDEADITNDFYTFGWECVE